MSFPPGSISWRRISAGIPASATAPTFCRASSARRWTGRSGRSLWAPCRPREIRKTRSPFPRSTTSSPKSRWTRCERSRQLSGFTGKDIDGLVRYPKTRAAAVANPTNQLIAVIAGFATAQLYLLPLLFRVGYRWGRLVGAHRQASAAAINLATGCPSPSIRGYRDVRHQLGSTRRGGSGRGSNRSPGSLATCRTTSSSPSRRRLSTVVQGCSLLVADVEKNLSGVEPGSGTAADVISAAVASVKALYPAGRQQAGPRSGRDDGAHPYDPPKAAAAGQHCRTLSTRSRGP